MGMAGSALSGSVPPGRDTEMNVTNKHYVLGTPIKPPFPSNMQSIAVATGCFWGAEKGFWRIPGVYSTAVGYIGGETLNPTYKEACSGRSGHTEGVLVVYDPSKVALTDLLRMFWQCHDPTQGNGQGNDRGSQYRSGIYCYTKEQRSVVDASKAAYEKALQTNGKGRGKTITTEIKGPSPPTWFYAEDYHQQYLAKPGARPYCSAQPTGVNMPISTSYLSGEVASKYVEKLSESFWAKNAPRPHSVIKASNEQIKTCGS